MFRDARKASTGQRDENVKMRNQVSRGQLVGNMVIFGRSDVWVILSMMLSILVPIRCLYI